MTTSQSTTFSPSSLSTTRSTPCVLGCCGPMLITSSLVSNIAPWWTVGELFNLRLLLGLTQFQPVDRIFHQQLARAFERVVLPLRMALPVLGHQNAPPIGMSDEIHAEHVEHLALEPVRSRPDAGHRSERLPVTNFDLHAKPLPVPDREQTVDNVEPLRTGRPVG